MLAISLLGAPRVARDGVAIEVDTRKAIALLAYLAVTARGHTRDALAALLWPEYDSEHARGALRRTLSALRKAVGAERVEAGRETIALVRGPDVVVDVAEFRARLAAGTAASAREAVELYRGDFLAGFGLRDSVNFEDWQCFEADSLRRELAGALERLVAAGVERGAYDQAIADARRWLELNPLHEPAHRRLIELLARKGERATALHQYRQCVRILQRELGVTPLSETTDLYRAIVEGRLERSAAPTAPPPAASLGGQPARLPLVGRTAEWETLRGAYEGIGGDGGLVAVEGDAGLGKSRLVGDFLDHARAGGAATLAERCHEDESRLAFAPIIGLARSALARLEDVSPHARAELSRLLPELGPPPPLPLERPDARARFLEGVTQLLLAACAGRRPGVLFLDDVQWADEASLDLLCYLSRRLTGRPVLVVLSWRSEEVPRGHRLRRLVAEAERSASTGAIRLGPLTEADVRTLVGAVAPRAPVQASRRVHEVTDGVPLFVAECLGALGRGEERWDVPGGMRELLCSRLASPSDPARQVLTAAAVIGRDFDVETVRDVSGRSDEETVAALEELAGRGLVEEAGDHYDFRHEHLRSLAYEQASLARRRLLHRRAAETLAARARAGAGAHGLSGSIARHYQLAGRDAEAAEHFVGAGHHARALYANADALGHYRSALALGHPDVAGLHEAIGDVQTLLGHYPAALASFEAAAAHAAPEGIPALEHKLGALHGRRGNWDLAEAHLAAALPSADENRRARVQADRSLLALRQDHSALALELAQAALELAQAAGDPEALAQTHNILGIVFTRKGEPARGREHLEASLALAETLPDPTPRIAALNNLAMFHSAAGEPERALELAREALQRCAAQGDRHREAALHSNLADLLHRIGRRDEALAHLRQSAAIFAELGPGETMEPEIWKLVEW